jgi:hypothetical protein
MSELAPWLYLPVFYAILNFHDVSYAEVLRLKQEFARRWWYFGRL